MSISVYGRALRVYQWPKNLVALGALVFAQQLHVPAQAARAGLTFALLCAASSAVYLFNDLLDAEKDRQHPEKRHRPLASGAMSKATALVLMALLAGAGLAGAYALRPALAAGVFGYLVLNVAYSAGLKRVMLVDVLVVAGGFVLRAILGAVALSVAFSNWLVVCTLFLALFLGLGKRRREIELMEAGAGGHRAVLDHYTVPFLDALMTIMAAATLLTYTIYTCSPEVVARVGTDKLYLTLPFVVYGLFRYLYLVHQQGSGGDPSRTLITDAPLVAAVLSWGLACVGILYWERLQ